MPLILGAQSAAADTAVVTNSGRWNLADSPEMEYTQAAGDRQKFTLSLWMKFQVPDGIDYNIFKSWSGGGAGINFRMTDGGVFSFNATSSFTILLERKFRDPAAWYHIVFACDTTESVAANRVIVYVNGVRITDFTTETQPSLNDNLLVNQSSDVIYFGVAQNSTNFYDGYFAEVVYIDGTQYAASDFGEFDTDSPTMWKPKDVSGLTFGTNGFYLDFEDSANLGADVSGEGNDFTETNFATTDQATDTPVNNFCTLNIIGGQLPNTSNTSWTLEEGNCLFRSASVYSQWISGTLGMTGGKWYWEIIADGTFDGNDTVPYLGVINGDLLTVRQALTSPTATSSDHASVTGNGNLYDFGSDTASWGDTFENGDLVMIAVDCDNGKLWWGINGTWQKSGAVGIPADGTNPSITFTAGTLLMPYILGWQDTTSANPIKCNFGGCPPFAITSGNSDENNFGNFEYAVPAGFLALCTKNLGSDGG
jgi:hypothetical protein